MGTLSSHSSYDHIILLICSHFLDSSFLRLGFTKAIEDEVAVEANKTLQGCRACPNGVMASEEAPWVKGIAF